MSVQVMFVCLGNICRSPTAHGVFQKLVEDAGLAQQVSVESSGTAAWHVGKSPDRRSVAAAGERGYDLSQLVARQVCTGDFEQYDYVLAMDRSNLQDLEDIAPPGYRGHLGLFLSFGQQQSYLEVPDPYYGDGKGFELVLDLVEDAANGLLNHIKRRHL